jgi:hypothetical protein
MFLQTTASLDKLHVENGAEELLETGSLSIREYYS